MKQIAVIIFLLTFNIVYGQNVDSLKNISLYKTGVNAKISNAIYDKGEVVLFLALYDSVRTEAISLIHLDTCGKKVSEVKVLDLSSKNIQIADKTEYLAQIKTSNNELVMVSNFTSTDHKQLIFLKTTLEGKLLNQTLYPLLPDSYEVEPVKIKEVKDGFLILGVFQKISFDQAIANPFVLKLDKNGKFSWMWNYSKFQFTSLSYPLGLEINDNDTYSVLINDNTISKIIAVDLDSLGKEITVAKKNYSFQIYNDAIFDENKNWLIIGNKCKDTTCINTIANYTILDKKLNFINNFSIDTKLYSDINFNTEIISIQKEIDGLYLVLWDGKNKFLAKQNLKGFIEWIKKVDTPFLKNDLLAMNSLVSLPSKNKLLFGYNFIQKNNNSQYFAEPWFSKFDAKGNLVKNCSTLEAVSVVGNDNFKLFPNPATNAIFISNDVSDFLLNTKILNLEGKILIEKYFSDSIEIDISELSKGVYFLTIEKNNQTISSKQFFKN